MPLRLPTTRSLRKCPVAVALALCFPALSGNRRVQAADTYRAYTNARFGYTLEYAVPLLVAKPEADNGDGRRFESRERKVLLRAFGSYNTDGETLGDRLRSVAADWRSDGAHITYQKLGPGWYALSGFVGNDIFYEKALLHNGTFATIIWEYAKSVRRRLDAPVTRTVRSFRFVSPVRVADPRMEGPPPTPRPTAPRLSATPRPMATPRPTPTHRHAARPTKSRPGKSGAHQARPSSEGY